MTPAEHLEAAAGAALIFALLFLSLSL